jgi:hypothetical protein
MQIALDGALFQWIIVGANDRRRRDDQSEKVQRLGKFLATVTDYVTVVTVRGSRFAGSPTPDSGRSDSL